MSFRRKADFSIFCSERTLFVQPRQTRQWQVECVLFMIKNIIFDIGGVLYTNGTKIFREKLRLRYSIDEEKLHLELGEHGGAGELYRQGKISRNEFWQTVLTKFNLKESVDELENEWVNCYLPNRKVDEIISKLKDKHKLYYLSNSVQERVRHLKLLSTFDGGVFSHEVGVSKPDVKIYQMLVDKYQINSSESIYIDDKEKNLPPARELGMKTILFTNAADLKLSLDQLLA